jgi:hypothetical protein
VVARGPFVCQWYGRARGGNAAAPFLFVLFLGLGNGPVGLSVAGVWGS